MQFQFFSQLFRNFRNLNFSSTLLPLIGWGWIFVIPSWIVTGFYFGIPVTKQLIFKVEDGWCDVPAESIGKHCFGDYYLSMDLVSQVNVWNNSFGVPQPYSAIGMLPHSISLWLTEILHSPTAALGIWLFIMAMFMLVPAYIISIQLTLNKWIPFVVLGVGATPFIQVLDRGNSVGFAVTFLTLFVWGIFRNNSYASIIGLTLLIGLRPQYAILLLLFIPLKRHKELLLTILSAILITILSFVFWPGDRTDNFFGWFENISNFGAYASVSSNYPVSYSSSHSLWIISEWMSSLSFMKNVIESFQIWLVDHSSVPGLLLVLLVLIAIGLASFWGKGVVSMELLMIILVPLPMIVPGTSWSYYSLFALVIAAAIFVHPERWTLKRATTANQNLRAGILDTPNSPFWFRLLVLLVVVVSVLPMAAVPLNFDEIKSGSAYFGLFTQIIGASWLLVVILGCVIIYFRVAKKLTIKSHQYQGLKSD